MVWLNTNFEKLEWLPEHETKEIYWNEVLVERQNKIFAIYSNFKIAPSSFIFIESSLIYVNLEKK
jgi:hypothetical protein